MLDEIGAQQIMNTRTVDVSTENPLRLNSIDSKNHTNSFQSLNSSRDSQRKPESILNESTRNDDLLSIVK